MTGREVTAARAIWSRTWIIIALVLVIVAGVVPYVRISELASRNAQQIGCLDDALQARAASSSSDAAANVIESVALAAWVSSVGELFKLPPGGNAAEAKAVVGVFATQTANLQAVTAQTAITLAADQKVRDAHPFARC